MCISIRYCIIHIWQLWMFGELQAVKLAVVRREGEEETIFLMHCLALKIIRHAFCANYTILHHYINNNTLRTTNGSVWVHDFQKTDTCYKLCKYVVHFLPIFCVSPAAAVAQYARQPCLLLGGWIHTGGSRRHGQVPVSVCCCSCWEIQMRLKHWVSRKHTRHLWCYVKYFCFSLYVSLSLLCYIFNGKKCAIRVLVFVLLYYQIKTNRICGFPRIIISRSKCIVLIIFKEFIIWLS